QLPSVTQKLLSSAQCALQFAAVKQVLVAPAHVPGRQVADVQVLVPVHGSAVAWSAVHVWVAAARSQNRPLVHCVLDVQVAPAASSGWQTPTSQNRPLAQPWTAHDMPSVGSAVHTRLALQKLSLAHS